jgi:hypothetical protein
MIVKLLLYRELLKLSVNILTFCKHFMNLGKKLHCYDKKVIKFKPKKQF